MDLGIGYTILKEGFNDQEQKVEKLLKSEIDFLNNLELKLDISKPSAKATVSKINRRREFVNEILGYAEMTKNVMEFLEGKVSEEIQRSLHVTIANENQYRLLKQLNE